MGKPAETSVQSKRITPRVKPWLTVGDPIDNPGADVVRFTIDIAPDDFKLAKQVAAYRNALAAVQGKRLKRLWTRKSIGETVYALGAIEMRKQLAEMIKQCGPLPDEGDDLAMRRYAEKVIAWSDKLK